MVYEPSLGDHDSAQTQHSAVVQSKVSLMPMDSEKLIKEQELTFMSCSNVRRLSYVSLV